MKFISLTAVLCAMAPDVANICPNEEDTEEDAAKKLNTRTDQLSRISALLHAKLHNASERPQGFEIDAETGEPLRQCRVIEDRLAILKHMAGQSRRDADELGRHIYACIANGVDPATVPQSHSMADLRKFPLFRKSQIGFDLAEIVHFLDANGIAHDLGGLIQTAPAPDTRAGQGVAVGAESEPDMKATKRPTLWDVATPYIVETMKAKQFADAKRLFKELEAKAGKNSPFDKGEGPNRGVLFVREIAQTLALKTLQNNFPKLKEAAKK